MEKWKNILKSGDQNLKEKYKRSEESLNEKIEIWKKLEPEIIEKVNNLRKVLSEFSSVKVTDPTSEIYENSNFRWSIKFPKHGFTILKVFFYVHIHYDGSTRCQATTTAVRYPTKKWNSKKNNLDELIEEFLETYKEEIIARAPPSFIDKIW